LNPSPAPSPEEKDKLAILDNILRYVDYLIVNVTEAELLGGLPAGSIQDIVDKGDFKDFKPHLDKVCTILSTKGATHVIITLGAQGSYIKSAESKETVHTKEGFYFPAMKAKVVDTTGAGDTFLGAFAAKTACMMAEPYGTGIEGRQLALLTAVRYGASAAAMSVEKPGAQSSIPTAAEVEEDMHTNKTRYSEQKSPATVQSDQISDFFHRQ